MHIFDHTLKPILFYNSEVWGSYHISIDRLNTRAFDLDNIFKSLQCEKLHHKKSVNFAEFSELGRSPLHFNIVISLVKYWYRLVNLLNESKLLDDAYICSKNVANEGKQSWFLFTEKLLKFIGIQNKGLGAIRAKIGPTSNVDKIFSKMYSHTICAFQK
jgi:hypothetical protein